MAEVKKINSNDKYSRAIIEYTVLWAQYMEYLMFKHKKRIADIWKVCSYMAAMVGITYCMYITAIDILNAFWKYGKEIRKLHQETMEVTKS